MFRRFIQNSVVLGGAVVALSCSDSPPACPQDFGDSFDRSTFLSHVGADIVLPRLEAFTSEVDALITASTAYCVALGTGDEAATRTSAQDAWKSALGAWQVYESMNIGPGADDDDALRDLVYSWPDAVSACAVDRGVADIVAEPNRTFSADLANRRGLDAIEYALFATDLNSVCPPQVAPEGWDELSDDDRRQARCDFAVAAAQDVLDQANTLVTAWRASGGDFIGELANAGASSESYSTVCEGMDDVFGVLFYLDVVTKDAKLAEPLGLLRNDCGATDSACVAELESPYAEYGKEAILANLSGFRQLFVGANSEGQAGQGFDDMLIARGNSELATSIIAAIGAAEAAVTEIPATMQVTLVDDYETIADAHAAVKAITDLIKSDVPEVLELNIPLEAGGDND